MTVGVPMRVFVSAAESLLKSIVRPVFRPMQTYGNVNNEILANIGAGEDEFIDYRVGFIENVKVPFGRGLMILKRYVHATSQSASVQWDHIRLGCRSTLAALTRPKFGVIPSLRLAIRPGVESVIFQDGQTYVGWIAIVSSTAMGDLNVGCRVAEAGILPARMSLMASIRGF